MTNHQNLRAIKCLKTRIYIMHSKPWKQSSWTTFLSSSWAARWESAWEYGMCLPHKCYRLSSLSLGTRNPHRYRYQPLPELNTMELPRQLVLQEEYWLLIIVRTPTLRFNDAHAGHNEPGSHRMTLRWRTTATVNWSRIRLLPVDTTWRL